MVNRKPVITLPLHLDGALAMVALQLVAKGLRVSNSFEINSSCASFTEEICPHRGTGPCECRLCVLQVYDENFNSEHLVLHECDGKTEFFLYQMECSENTDLGFSGEKFTARRKQSHSIFFWDMNKQEQQDKFV